MNNPSGFETAELQQAFDVICSDQTVCQQLMITAIECWQQAEPLPDPDDPDEVYRRYQIADSNLAGYLQMEIPKCEDIDEMYLQEIAPCFLYRLRPYILERKYDIPNDDDQTNQLFDKLLTSAFDPDDPPDTFPEPVRFCDGGLV